MTQEEFFKRYTYSVSRDRIGGGGFGTVYKAKDTLLHRTVAIKVSEVKTTADGQKTFSLKDEFEALNHVPKHPNIANYEEFYSFESPQGIFDYAVMQYYPDGNLSNAIKEGLTDAQKEDVAAQLLEGIGFLHQHKVVHRDLKPSNILIIRDGDKVIPLITDFGLSKAANLADGSVFTNSLGGGTPRYSSPEQLQGQPLRFNTDLWSFGAILYEVFTGEQLFSSSSGAVNTPKADLEIYNKILRGEVNAISKMPEKWRKVAERCLVVDPEKRAKSVEELVFVLKGEEERTEVNVGFRAIGQRPSTESEASKPIPIPVREDSKRRGKGKTGLVIGLILMVAAIVYALLLLKPWIEMHVPTLLHGRSSEQTTESPSPNRVESNNSTSLTSTEIPSSTPTESSSSTPTNNPSLTPTESPSSTPAKEPDNSSSSLSFTVHGVSFVMKKVEGGTFQMGSNDSEADSDEKPVHSVKISSFYIGETEVTQALWKAVMGEEPTNHGGWEDQNGRGSNYPAYRVSWNDCQEFIQKLIKLTGKRFRLPTEAEWEYAARGGKNGNATRYSGSDNIGSVAWYYENKGDKANVVKKKSPNELGLYDMSGNVYEWCSDWYGSSYYYNTSSSNPEGPASGSGRVLRGGSWSNRAKNCRVSNRYYYAPSAGSYCVGLRLVLPC